jgi:hypothetical protein
MEDLGIVSKRRNWLSTARSLYHTTRHCRHEYRKPVSFQLRKYS